MKMSQFVRSAAAKAALAITAVGVYAPPASAARRNPCQDAWNHYIAMDALAVFWMSHANTLLIIGASQALIADAEHRWRAYNTVAQIAFTYAGEVCR